MIKYNNLFYVFNRTIVSSINMLPTFKIPEYFKEEPVFTLYIPDPDKPPNDDNDKSDDLNDNRQKKIIDEKFKDKKKKETEDYPLIED